MARHQTCTARRSHQELCSLRDSGQADGDVPKVRAMQLRASPRTVILLSFPCRACAREGVGRESVFKASPRRAAKEAGVRRRGRVKGMKQLAQF